MSGAAWLWLVARVKRDLKELATAEPDLAELKTDFQLAVEQRDTTVFRRQRLNYRARHCIWANQSEDGKKWRANKGEKPFPWPGASDARVALVDKYINEDVSFLMVLNDRMRTLVSGTQSNEAAFAHRLTNLLRWMKATQMREFPRELRLTANYMLERGSAVLGVFWERQTQLGYDSIDMEKIVQLSQQAQQMGQQMQLTQQQKVIAQLPTMILDPQYDTQAAAALGVIYKGVRPVRLRKAVKELRETGTTKIPRPYLVKNRPTVVALSPNEEVFLPPETTDLQMARAVWRRELISESLLRERVNSHEWKQEWVDEMIETQRGNLTLDYGLSGAAQRISSAGNLNTQNLFEVVHGYRRLADADGVPGIYYTCFNPHVVDSYAYHGLLDYDHGEYPFVHFSREHRSRLLDDTRGYGEVAFTWQQQMKTQWDSRVDRASIATLPPSHYPVGEPPDKWGPGVQVPTVRPEDYGFMEPPKYDPGSQEVEESVRRFSDEYFGRPVDEQNAVQSQVMRQDLGNLWMGYCAAVDTQILKLCQQFESDDIYFRVVGSSKSQPLHATRDEIQGEFDVSVSYNVADLNNEVVTAKMGLIEQALQMDTTGRVDRNQALDVVFDLIDPDIGERILTPAEDVNQKEIDDEQSVYTKLAAGIGVDVRPGQNYKLRSDVLNNIVQTSPKAQEQLQTDQNFRQLLESRMKQLAFQVTEQENAVTGRLGSAPSKQAAPAMGQGQGQPSQ